MIVCVPHPPWPAEAQRLKESADMREAALGRLLFAQWEQAHAAASMAQDYAAGTGRHAAAAEAQRRAYRDMVTARCALEVLA